MQQQKSYSKVWFITGAARGIGLDGKQAGDPEKVATLILQAANAAEPPVHLCARNAVRRWLAAAA